MGQRRCLGSTAAVFFITTIKSFILRVGAHTFGAARDVIQSRLWQLAMGADLTFYTKPSILDSSYGKNPVSFQVFLRVRPALSHHEH
jgi:hypothetical protein